MAEITILICAIILVLLITFKNSLEGNMRTLMGAVLKLQDEVIKLRTENKNLRETIESKPIVTEVPVQTPKPEPVWENIRPQATPEPIKKEPTPSPVMEEVIQEYIPPVYEIPVEPVPVFDAVEEPVVPVMEEAFAFQENTASPGEPVEEWYAPTRDKKEKTFFELHPDLEKFVGENIINKIGIAILVLGIGFFVKYAIDKDWINAIGRTCIGLLCGGILVGTAHVLRKNFKAFSSVLVGGGLAVFYFTIAISFHEYHLFSQAVAFILMVIITGFSVLLSIGYNRQELAILAIIGGFTTPFMVSTGEGNYIVLFTYLIILNVGMLVLAYFKKWHLINIISYVFTVILYGGWLCARVLGEKNAPYIGALSFATAFYVIFFLMNIINNVREKLVFSYREIIILLSNTFLYFSAGIIILHFVNGGAYQGLFTACIGVFNLVFAQILFRNKNVDRNLLYLLIGLVLTFMSLTAPIQLHGNHITIFWAAEAVLLLWLAQKSGIKIIKLASAMVLALMVISLVMDWGQVYWMQKYGNLDILLNRGFITSIISIASVYLYRMLLKNEQGEYFLIPDIEVKYLKISLLAMFYLFLFATGLLELNYQLRAYQENLITINLILGFYHYLWVIFIMLAARAKGGSDTNVVTSGLGLMAIISYLIMYHLQTINARNEYLTGESGMFAFLLHYALLGQVLLILGICYSNIQRRSSFQSVNSRFFLWLFSGIILFICSSELDHIMVFIGYSGKNSIQDLLISSHKIGYPVLWGIFAFILMISGMKRKMRDLRIISLAVILLALVKFLFDLQSASNIGRIIASICLGVLLLVMSFLYQKIKRLIVDDGAVKSEDSAEDENTSEEIAI